MYLGELGADSTTQLINVDTDSQCKAAGGTVIGYVRQGTAAYDQYGRKIPGNVRCAIKTVSATAQTTPVNVTVSPTVQTQVSPQISPNFQQQFQPSNSPMTAGTTQSSAPSQPQGSSSVPSQPQGGISQADLEAALAKQRAEFAAAITQAGITNQSQQLPAVSAAPVYVPPSVPVTTGDAQLPVSPLPSSVSSSGTEPVTSTATTTNPTNSLDLKSTIMIGAGLLGVLLLSSNKRA